MADDDRETQSPNGRYIRFADKLETDEKRGIVTYRGFDHHAGCEIAWNVVQLRSLPSQVKAGLVEELKLRVQLRHPRLLNVYQAWGDERREEVNFVTDLLIYSRRMRHVLPKVAMRWAAQVLDALWYLHASGVVHRAVRLENLFIKGNSSDVVVGGFASAMDTHLSKLEMKGKMVPVPPVPSEADAQRAGPALAAVDVRDLGLCLLELVTGKDPTKGDVCRLLSQVDDEDMRRFVCKCLCIHQSTADAAAGYREGRRQRQEGREDGPSEEEVEALVVPDSELTQVPASYARVLMEDPWVASVTGKLISERHERVQGNVRSARDDVRRARGVGHGAGGDSTDKGATAGAGPDSEGELLAAQDRCSRAERELDNYILEFQNLAQAGLISNEERLSLEKVSLGLGDAAVGREPAPSPALPSTGGSERGKGAAEDREGEEGEGRAEEDEDATTDLAMDGTVEAGSESGMNYTAAAVGEPVTPAMALEDVDEGESEGAVGGGEEHSDGSTAGAAAGHAAALTEGQATRSRRPSEHSAGAVETEGVSAGPLSSEMPASEGGTSSSSDSEESSTSDSAADDAGAEDGEEAGGGGAEGGVGDGAQGPGASADESDNEGGVGEPAGGGARRGRRRRRRRRGRGDEENDGEEEEEEGDIPAVGNRVPRRRRGDTFQGTDMAGLEVLGEEEGSVQVEPALRIGAQGVSDDDDEEEGAEDEGEGEADEGEADEGEADVNSKPGTRTSGTGGPSNGDGRAARKTSPRRRPQVVVRPAPQESDGDEGAGQSSVDQAAAGVQAQGQPTLVADTASAGGASGDGASGAARIVGAEVVTVASSSSVGGGEGRGQEPARRPGASAGPQVARAATGRGDGAPVHRSMGVGALRDAMGRREVSAQQAQSRIHRPGSGASVVPQQLPTGSETGPVSDSLEPVVRSMAQRGATANVRRPSTTSGESGVEYNSAYGPVADVAVDSRISPTHGGDGNAEPVFERVTGKNGDEEDEEDEEDDDDDEDDEEDDEGEGGDDGYSSDDNEHAQEEEHGALGHRRGRRAVPGRRRRQVRRGRGGSRRRRHDSEHETPYTAPRDATEHRSPSLSARVHSEGAPTPDHGAEEEVHVDVHSPSAQSTPARSTPPRAVTPASLHPLPPPTQPGGAEDREWRLGRRREVEESRAFSGPHHVSGSRRGKGFPVSAQASSAAAASTAVHTSAVSSAYTAAAASAADAALLTPVRADSQHVDYDDGARGVHRSRRVRSELRSSIERDRAVSADVGDGEWGPRSRSPSLQPVYEAPYAPAAATLPAVDVVCTGVRRVPAATEGAAPVVHLLLRAVLPVASGQSIHFCQLDFEADPARESASVIIQELQRERVAERVHLEPRTTAELEHALSPFLPPTEA